MRKPSSESSVVETSVTNNSPSQDSNHPDDLFQSRYLTSGFKPFSYFSYLVAVVVIVHMCRLPAHVIPLISYFIYTLKVTRVHC